MYKVMLVDDDYPVLELLSEAIQWEELGLSLIGLYENGAVALEAAQANMPDIIVTDIGMPKLNGLELIQSLKERNPKIRVAILSCHSEFHYAQQAMRLQVEDYLLKDTLNPDDVSKLLQQFKSSLDQEMNSSEKQNQLRHMVDRNREGYKESFIRGTIQGPILDERAWIEEASSFGLQIAGRVCLPIACYVDGQRAAKQRYVSEDVLRFAINNIVEEILGNEELSAVHFTYDSLRSILVLSFQAGIKVNPFERATQLVNMLQVMVKRTLKISLTFIMGKNCQGALELKHELTELLAAVGQRFYLAPSSIEKRATITYAKEDLFSWYDEALKEFRDILMDGKASSMKPAVARWVGFIQQHSFGPETVKDWVLKLVLDLKLKLQSMQLFRNHFSVDILHREILDIATLAELEDWLTDYFENSFAIADEVKELSKRPEIWSACQYVSLHLDKKISLDEVAEHLFLNPSYFSRLFKKEMGETYIEYVSRMKVARAKELLDQTNLTVGKICEMLGYDNHSYFVKMFKTVAGVTPMEYRGASASR